MTAKAVEREGDEPVWGTTFTKVNLSSVRAIVVYDGRRIGPTLAEAPITD